jgi:photosystem II stability/assembly factor-like uncharacterized protein
MLEDVHGPIAVDPFDSDVIYVAVRGTTSLAYSSGMLKSTDGGQTWEHYTDGWLISDPKDILIHPDNPGEILVSGGTGVAVVKSTDGGQTWEEKFEGMPRRVNHLARVPGSHTLYAATSGGVQVSF